MHTNSKVIIRRIYFIYFVLCLGQVGMLNSGLEENSGWKWVKVSDERGLCGLRLGYLLGIYGEVIQLDVSYSCKTDLYIKSNKICTLNTIIIAAARCHTVHIFPEQFREQIKKFRLHTCQISGFVMCRAQKHISMEGPPQNV